ncbi:sensor histidine kinase [Massilia arenosa]|uniref:histidine kinase n=1 Tax=Zemynaea arenosa TaxID=2561931 RepID=A0A4Y9SHX9_9BURK|nr:histidine kinase [Massilia arenosa]TFW21420.1 sensor histidine kinase [Massilia arenosa]
MHSVPVNKLLRDAGYVTIFNVACALAVTFILGSRSTFFENLVFSMCIGYIAFIIIDVLRFLMWGATGRPNWTIFPLILIGAVVIAQMSGTALASWLLGHRNFSLDAFLSGRTFHAGSVFFTLLATAAASIFFSGRERLLKAQAEAANERARAEAVERQAVQAQLQLLQTQLEPHMLFNTLANVQGLIAIDPPRAQEMLDQLIQYLRATLSSSRAQATTLAQEFALMEAYLGLMSIRMGARLNYALELPPALAEARVPPMLLQPLVENAVAHGVEPKVEGGHIAVGARREAERLVLSVTDNGRGLDAPPGKPGTNVGLSNTRARLQALYGERASLSLHAAPDGGCVATITLPIETP